MHNIYDCVDSFVSLLDTEYRLTLGRKGEAVSLNITFDKKDCFHLMGLQYLTDRPELSRDRGKIFDEIKARVLTKEQIESSDLYEQIIDRIDLLPFLEDLFDSNDTVFKYNEKKNSFSMLKANYLMKNRLADKNVFIFLSKSKDDTYFCRSFFPETNRDYTKNQASWTLLYKEKVNRTTGQSVVLYDRLKRD